MCELQLNVLSSFTASCLVMSSPKKREGGLGTLTAIIFGNSESYGYLALLLKEVFLSRDILLVLQRALVDVAYIRGFAYGIGSRDEASSVPSTSTVLLARPYI